MDAPEGYLLGRGADTLIHYLKSQPDARSIFGEEIFEVLSTSAEGARLCPGCKHEARKLGREAQRHRGPEVY